MDPAWPAGLRDACQAAGVPYFFKQWGGPTPKAGGRLLDGRTWDEMPQRVTEGQLRPRPSSPAAVLARR
jgi:protein gp37